jgi:uncharacterized membrane protein
MKYPIKVTFNTEILPLTMVAMAWVASLFFYTHFPSQVAVHWDMAGQVNGYAGRVEGAFILPIILTVMYALFLVLPIADPKRERYAEFDHYYRLFRTAIMALLLVIYAASGLFNLGYPVQISTVVSGSVGILFIVLGNFMGKIKNNWFVGIRTPWTLSSENVWNKTHRMGGWLFVIYGLIIMATPYLPRALAAGLFVLGAVLLTLGTMGYSYWLFKQEQK